MSLQLRVHDVKNFQNLENCQNLENIIFFLSYKRVRRGTSNSV